jgi:very-short-patch-repair endonuclease
VRVIDGIPLTVPSRTLLDLAEVLDRLRDAELEEAGLWVIRVTWRQLTEQPYAAVARLARALGAARRGLAL